MNSQAATCRRFEAAISGRLLNLTGTDGDYPFVIIRFVKFSQGRTSSAAYGRLLEHIVSL